MAMKHVPESVCVCVTWAVPTQMDLIVCSENGKASSTDILNSADTLTTKKLKKSETEHLLNRLVHDQWLNEVQHWTPFPHNFWKSNLSHILSVTFSTNSSHFLCGQGFVISQGFSAPS